MSRLLWILAFTLSPIGAVSVAAEPADPLKSVACQQALERLQRQEAQAALAAPVRAQDDPRLPRPDALVRARRREAARICLGSRPNLPQPPPPQRQVQPPIRGTLPASPSASPTLPEIARPAPLPQQAAPPPRSGAPTVITSCDPTGCWASDGSRLNRMGPNLLGPRGLCTVQGNLLQCP